MAWLRQMWNRQFDQYSCDDNYRWEIKFTHFALGTTGIWPGGGKTDSMRFLISLTTMVLFLTLPQDGQLFLIENESQLLASVGSTLRHIHLIGSMFLLRFNSNVRQYILEEMQENWKTNSCEEDGKIMHRYAEISRRITWIMITTKVCTLVVQYSNRLVINQGKLTITPGYSYYPFSLSNAYVHTLCFITDVTAITLSMILNGGINFSFFGFMLHACGQLSILGERIKTYDGKIRHASEENISRKCSCLKCIVDSHVRICEFVKKIDDYFNIIILMTLAWSVINVSCTAFQFLEAIGTGDYGKLLTNIVYTSVVVLTLFLYCCVAEMCQQKGYALCEIAYSTDWMTKEPKISRNLIFIIRHTRIPLKITAVKYYVLSLSLFKEFISTSLSYLSVLVSIKLSK